MSVDTVEKIFDLELEILRQGDGMSADDAYYYHGMLSSNYANFMEAQCYFLKDFSNGVTDHEEKSLHVWVDIGECVQKKVTRLQKMLKGFFLPPEPIPQIESNTENLESLLRKQKIYIHMIDLFSPTLENELSTNTNKTEVKYEHVTEYYKKFVANQNEIMTLVGEDGFDDQVNLSEEIHRKVFSIRKSLKEILSPNNPAVLDESKVNEHLNRVDRPNVIVEFLDSRYKQQKSLMEQIESIESKNNPSAVEAEILFSHLSQLHGSFIQNQAKIETYVNGPALDKELELSRKMLEKIISLQIKLKKIFAPSVSPSLTKSKPMDKSEKVSKTDNSIYLNSLLEKQKSLISDIESMKTYQHVYQQNPQFFPAEFATFLSENEVKSSLKSLLELKTLFISNQSEIEKLVNDNDLRKQKEISEFTQIKLRKIQKEYEFYIAFDEYSQASKLVSSFSCS